MIQEAVDLVKRTRGETLDIERIPVDDKATFDLLNRGALKLDALEMVVLDEAGSARLRSVDRGQRLRKQ